MPSTSKQDEDALTIVELVFSCSICQATPAEIYSTVESNHGFSGTCRDDGVVTKMWIADCAHVTCSKHLPNGAMPFHPKDQSPKAPCPRCSLDHGDHHPKQMYSLRGLSSGEHDSIVPEEWFQCPPMTLDTSIPGMEAVRFQYSALSIYARQARKHWKNCERKLLSMEADYSRERNNERQARAEIVELKNRVASLEKSESDLKKWEARKGIINHYLNQVGDMAKEIATLRNTCRRAGYQVSEYNFTFDLDHHNGPQDESGKHQVQEYIPSSNVPPIQTARAYEAEIGGFKNNSSSSVRKRKRDDMSDVGATRQQGHLRQYEPRGSSRDLMPPPLPRQRASQRPLLPQTTHDKLPLAGSVRLSNADHRSGSVLNAADANARAIPSAYHNPGQIRISYDAHKSRDEDLDFMQQSAARRSDLRVGDVENEYLPQHHHHDVQPFSRLSLTSPQKRTSTLSSRISHYDSAYDRIAQQTDVQPQRERLRTGASRVILRTPSPRKSNGPTASVISPFFKRDLTAAQPATAQCPPARGSPKCSEYGSRVYHPTRAYQMPAASVAGSQRFRNSQSVEAPSFINQLQHSNHRQQPSHSRNHHAPSEGANPQEYQVPRTSRSYYEHVRRPAQSASRASERSQQGMYSCHEGSRHPAAAQDRELVRVQGVRGIPSQKGTSFKYATSPTTGPNLFSSASVRRSVNR